MSETEGDISGGSGKTAITVGIIIVFFIIFILIVVFLYRKNQTNVADPNTYKYRRIFHVKSNTYLVLRLAQGFITNDTQALLNGYYPTLAIGGGKDDPMGLWNLDPEKGPDSSYYWYFQNSYTQKFSDDVINQTQNPQFPYFGVSINGNAAPKNPKAQYILTGSGGESAYMGTDGKLLPPLKFTAACRQYPLAPLIHGATYNTGSRVIIPFFTEKHPGDIFEIRVPVPSK